MTGPTIDMRDLIAHPADPRVLSATNRAEKSSSFAFLAPQQHNLGLRKEIAEPVCSEQVLCPPALSNTLTDIALLMHSFRTVLGW